MNLSADFISTFLEATLRMAVPLIFAGLGELFCERTGIINLSMEGSLLCGAFFGYTAMFYTNSYLLGFLAGILSAVLLNALHGLLTIQLYQNQTVVGIALSILASGLISFLYILSPASDGSLNIETLPSTPIPILSDIPIIGDVLFNEDIVAYIMFALVIFFSIFYKKTFWGMEFDAIGEHPQCADTLGINVFRKRWIALLSSGALCGIGGAYLTLVQVGKYTNSMASGRGYIALAIVVFGRRNPWGVFLASIFFGAANALQYRLQSMGIALPTQFLTGLPYLLTMIALVVFSKKGSDPAALAQPYIRGSR